MIYTNLQPFFSRVASQYEINVICWCAFQLEDTANEWQRARFGPAHTCPWVFSAWFWWTSTNRVKGLSYKSGTITLEVKTCTIPLSEGTRTLRGKKVQKKTWWREEEQDRSAQVIWSLHVWMYFQLKWNYQMTSA